MTGRRILFTMTVVLATLILALPVQAQENEQARFRIGYFAFDPREHDTYIDGELASFSDAWSFAAWRAPVPSNQFVCCSATPFMDIAAGVHTLAFVPAGEDQESAAVYTQDVTLVATHLHNLAVVGELGDSSLTIVNIDLTELAGEVDLRNAFSGALFNDLAGTPETVLRDGTGAEFPYLHYQADANEATGGGDPMYLELVADPPVVLVDTMSVPLPPGITDLGAISGTVPGRLGGTFAWYYNWESVDPVTIADAGAVVPGDTLVGEIAALAQRNQHRLSLDTESTLNISVLHGEQTARRASMTGIQFNPALFIYDAQGRLMYWNDDYRFPRVDAGFEGLRLPAGTYVLEVLGWLDSYAGMYTLEVQLAE